MTWNTKAVHDFVQFSPKLDKAGQTIWLQLEALFFYPLPIVKPDFYVREFQGGITS